VINSLSRLQLLLLLLLHTHTHRANQTDTLSTLLHSTHTWIHTHLLLPHSSSTPTRQAPQALQAMPLGGSLVGSPTTGWV